MPLRMPRGRLEAKRTHTAVCHCRFAIGASSMPLGQGRAGSLGGPVGSARRVCHWARAERCRWVGPSGWGGRFPGVCWSFSWRRLAGRRRSRMGSRPRPVANGLCSGIPVAYQWRTPVANSNSFIFAVDRRCGATRIKLIELIHLR